MFDPIKVTLWADFGRKAMDSIYLPHGTRYPHRAGLIPDIGLAHHGAEADGSEARLATPPIFEQRHKPERRRYGSTAIFSVTGH